MAVQYREQVGAALRARRVELRLTQAQVADRVETWLRENGKRDEGKPFDAQNISRWERGKNLGTTDNLEAVAAALETTVAQLLADVHTDGRQPREAGGQAQLDRMERELRESRAELHEMRDRLETFMDAWARQALPVLAGLGDELAERQQAQSEAARAAAPSRSKRAAS